MQFMYLHQQSGPGLGNIILRLANVIWICLYIEFSLYLFCVLYE